MHSPESLLPTEVVRELFPSLLDPLLLARIGQLSLVYTVTGSSPPGVTCRRGYNYGPGYLTRHKQN